MNRNSTTFPAFHHSPFISLKDKCSAVQWRPWQTWRQVLPLGSTKGACNRVETFPLQERPKNRANNVHLLRNHFPVDSAPEGPHALRRSPLFGALPLSTGPPSTFTFNFSTSNNDFDSRIHAPAVGAKVSVTIHSYKQ